MNDVVVAGASLAGLRTCETLRREGYDGRITLIGAERHLPYDRPPLSKQILSGEWALDRPFFPGTENGLAALELDLRLGVRAVELDPHGREVVLEDGSRVGFERLVIATGAAPRGLGLLADFDGVHALRTLDDALAVRSGFEGGGRVTVIGAGFIGAEVAASARMRGLDVTVIEAQPLPLAHALGPEMGAACARLHVDRGVDLRCGVTVRDVRGDGRVERLVLDDGTHVDTDLVVVAIGVAPAFDWLRSSGIELADGVVCDATGATSVPGVFAAGDVAQWYSPLFDQHLRVEHWSSAAEQGSAAARAILAGADGAKPLNSVPFFWSDQYDTKIQFAGRSHLADEVRVVHGSPDGGRFVALYGRAGRLVGALAFSWPSLLMKYRRLVGAGATWDEALDHAATVA